VPALATDGLTRDPATKAASPTTRRRRRNIGAP